jgi:hypothetical protein
METSNTSVLITAGLPRGKKFRQAWEALLHCSKEKYIRKIRGNVTVLKDIRYGKIPLKVKADIYNPLRCLLVNLIADFLIR